MTTLQTVVNEILDARNSISSERSVLTAISGIDASGKGYFTERLFERRHELLSAVGPVPFKHCFPWSQHFGGLDPSPSTHYIQL